MLALCRVSQVLTPQQEQRLPAIVEAVLAHLRDKALARIAKSQGQPVLYGYSADSTPLKSKAVLVYSKDGHTTYRHGYSLCECLFNRGFIITKDPATQEEKTAVVLSNVLNLSAGKNAGNYWAAASRFFSLLRKVGHRHISIHGFTRDRGILFSVELFLRQRHSAYYRPGLGPQPSAGEDPMMLELTDWWVSTGCACHDLQNAFGWGIGAHLSVQGFRDIYIVNTFATV